MIAGVSNVTFLTIELPLIRVFSSADVSLSGENLLEMVDTLVVNHGLDFRVMPPQPGVMASQGKLGTS